MEYSIGSLSDGLLVRRFMELYYITASTIHGLSIFETRNQLKDD